MNYQVVVLNLRRREDRWLVNLGGLIGQHVPLEHIIRFGAHDAADYDSFEECRDAVLSCYNVRYFSGAAPHDLRDLCWKWTYYNVLCEIATGILSAMPTLVLVDDFITRYTYGEIRTQLRYLSTLYSPLRVVQYDISSIRYPMIAFDDLEPVEGLPRFHHGLSGAGDRAVLFTRDGAAKLLEYINTNEHCLNQNPDQIMWLFSRDTERNGCYAVKAKMGLHNPHLNDIQDRTGKPVPKRHRIDTVERFQFMKSTR